MGHSETPNMGCLRLLEKRHLQAEVPSWGQTEPGTWRWLFSVGGAGVPCALGEPPCGCRDASWVSSGLGATDGTEAVFQRRSHLEHNSEALWCPACLGPDPDAASPQQFQLLFPG